MRGFSASLRPLPKDGRREGPQRTRNTSAVLRPAPKIDCDNALTGPQSGLYCAPLAACVAKRRGGERSLKKGSAEG
jgi:hypothetical protein